MFVSTKLPKKKLSIYTYAKYILRDTRERERSDK